MQLHDDDAYFFFVCSFYMHADKYITLRVTVRSSAPVKKKCFIIFQLVLNLILFFCNFGCMFCYYKYLTVSAMNGTSVIRMLFFGKYQYDFHASIQFVSVNHIICKSRYLARVLYYIKDKFKKKFKKDAVVSGLSWLNDDAVLYKIPIKLIRLPLLTSTIKKNLKCSTYILCSDTSIPTNIK